MSAVSEFEITNGFNQSERAERNLFQHRIKCNNILKAARLISHRIEDRMADMVKIKRLPSCSRIAERLQYRPTTGRTKENPNRERRSGFENHQSCRKSAR